MSVHVGDCSHVGELLALQARRHPDVDLLHFEDERYSYAEVNVIANQYAHGYLRLGVEKGSIVCALLPNCPEHIFAWMGLAKLGAVHAPLNVEFRGSGLLHLIESTDATVLFLDHDYAPQVADIAELLTKVTRIVYRAPESWVPDAALRRFELISLEHFVSPVDEDVLVTARPGDPLMLVFTSGTTGPAKPVEISHGYGLHSASERIWHIGLDRSDVLYSPYPLFHGAAPLCAFLPALLLGTTAVIARRFSASTFWDEMRAHGVTFFDFMGAVLVILSKQPPRPDDADNPVRVVAGIPAPGIWREFEARFGVKVMELYGTLECCEVAWDPLEEPHRDGACGRVCEHHEVRIVDADDGEVSRGEVGEIVVRGQVPYSQMTGYYGRALDTLEVFRNQWYHTGDNGYLDEDGWLHFVDRKKDAIRRRGKNISSFEVEDVANRHPAVLESAAIGVPSELSEEEVKLLVVPREGACVDPREVVEFSRQEMPRYMVPRYVEVVDHLPKTSTGKVNKVALKESWWTATTWDSDRDSRLDGELRPDEIDQGQRR